MNFKIFTNNFIAPVSHTHFLDMCWQNEYIYTAAGGRNVIIAQITWAPGALIYDDISTASYSIPWVKAKCKQKIADELLQLFTSLALWQTLSCCSLHRVINNNNGAQSASLKNKSNWTLRITNSEWTCWQKYSVHQFCVSQWTHLPIKMSLLTIEKRCECEQSKNLYCAGFQW